jgi:hypothetical protein
MFPLTLELWAAARSGSAQERFAVVMENLYREFRTLVTELVQAGKANGEFLADTDEKAVAAWLVGGLDGLMLQYWFDQSLNIQTWSENFLAWYCGELPVMPSMGEANEIPILVDTGMPADSRPGSQP